MLSDAIRQGCKRGPQVYGQWYDGNGGSCVMGAAAYGAGIPYNELTQWPDLVAFMRQYPYLHTPSNCPVDSCDSFYHVQNKSTLLEVLIHLNDRHLWSRETIADWLTPIANKQTEEKQLINA